MQYSMAGNNNWNLMRQGTYDVPTLSYAYRNLRPSTQIACRVCSQAFASNQELITHIEIHMLQQEINTTRQYNQFIRSNLVMASTQRQLMMLISNANRPNFNFQAPTMPALSRGANAFHRGSSPMIVAPTMPALQQTQQVASFPRDNIAVAPQPVPVQQSRPIRMMMEELPIGEDGTLPLIEQLERPIKRSRVVGDFEESDADASNLDLSLKL
ncbi:Zinc finger, C2H [Quillaja saponaria]|uniref:Zinc finger, C2H n=1 Tax=Quillaja saponaria TaxID=32244 RepID=A0AAD7LAR5_QUISA|nr:Zinc finger, C2H [Quillaja saponaria]